MPYNAPAIQPAKFPDNTHPQPKASFVDHLADGEELIKIARRMQAIKAEIAKEMGFGQSCCWSQVKFLSIEAGELQARTNLLLQNRRYRQMGGK